MLCREVTLEKGYLRVQCEVVRSKLPGRVRFTDEERRRLVDAALAMGRKAMWSVLTIVKPETILAWQRRLEQKKWCRRVPTASADRQQAHVAVQMMARTSDATSFRIARGC